MYYRKDGRKEELQMVGIGDASFKTDEKAVGGVIFLLMDKDSIKASLITP